MEPLNEPGIDGKGLVIRGRHLVVLDTVENSTVFHRALGEMMMMREFPLFIADSSAPSDFMKKYTTNVRSLSVFYINYMIILAYYYLINVKNSTVNYSVIFTRLIIVICYNNLFCYIHG